MLPWGGGGHFHIEGDGDVPLDREWFCGHQYWHSVSFGPLAVINIGTGYLVALLRSSILAQGIWIGLIGYWRATPFITGLLSRASQPTMFMTGSRSGHQRRCNIATGYHMNIFSKVYCDRFSTPSGTPRPHESRMPHPGTCYEIVVFEKYIYLSWRICSND